MPRKSKVSEGCGRSFGSTRNEYSSAPAPIGTLIRNIQCQLAMSISQPPRIGPAIGPSSIGTPSTAITRPTRSGPAARVMMVMPTGISMPPPRPWITRNVMSSPMPPAVLHSAEPATNSTSAVMYSRLVPNRSAAQPDNGITVASASV